MRSIITIFISSLTILFTILFLFFQPLAIAPVQAQLNITEAESTQLDILVKKPLKPPMQENFLRLNGIGRI